jgi:hypothetical protein
MRFEKVNKVGNHGNVTTNSQGGMRMVTNKENILAQSQRHWAKVEHCHRTPTLCFWPEQFKKQNGDQTLLDICKHESKPSTSPANLCTKLTRI